MKLARGWKGIIGFEDQPTGDGRLIESGGLFWDLDNPTAMRHVAKDVGAHDGASTVGKFVTIERRDNGEVYAEGTFDLGSATGREASRQLSEGFTTGVSMDLDSIAMELRVAKDVLNSMQDEPVEVDAGEGEDENGMVTVAVINPDDELSVMTAARIRGATMVAIPAFAGAVIEPTDFAEVDDDAPTDTTDEDDQDTVVASAVPDVPPAEWFQSPNLTEPTPLHVTDDGRVYGHLAAWGTCHTGFANECLTPPRSVASYAYFHTGAVSTTDGDVPVGRITMDTGHAGRTLSAAGTVTHYENTGAAVADVHAGEDGFGIWIAGAVRPGVTDEQVRTLRASPLSGDWRKVKGGLELMAALAVNVPGFPVPRPAALAASGFEIESLVASGMLLPADGGTAKESTLSSDDVAAIKQIASAYWADKSDTKRTESLERVHRLASQIGTTPTKGSGVKRIKIKAGS